MCSRIAAKLMNSSDESSMGSAVYFSSSVFTENLPCKHKQYNVLQMEKIDILLQYLENTTDSIWVFLLLDFPVDFIKKMSSYFIKFNCLLYVLWTVIEISKQKEVHFSILIKKCKQIVIFSDT